MVIPVSPLLLFERIFSGRLSSSPQVAAVAGQIVLELGGVAAVARSEQK